MSTHGAFAMTLSLQSGALSLGKATAVPPPPPALSIILHLSSSEDSKLTDVGQPSELTSQVPLTYELHLVGMWESVFSWWQLALELCPE